MYRNESGVIRHRTTHQNGKFMGNAGMFQSAFPSSQVSQYSSRGFCGHRFPQRNFRPFRRTPLLEEPNPRPTQMNMIDNYQVPHKYHQPCIVQHNERCPFPRNFAGSFPHNEYLPIPSRMAGSVETKFSNYRQSDASAFNSQKELWIETLSPDGRVYYYNATSRATTWDKPEPSKVLMIQHLNNLVGHAQDLRVQNQENICAPLNPLLPLQNYSIVPPNLIMFPPPNLCTLPPLFVPPAPIIDSSNVPHLPLNTAFPQGGFITSSTNEINETSTLEVKTSVPFSASSTPNTVCRMENQKEKIENAVQNNQSIFSDEKQMVLYSEIYPNATESGREDNKTHIKCNNKQSLWQVPKECTVSIEEGSTSKNVLSNVKTIQAFDEKTERDIAEFKLEEYEPKSSSLSDSTDITSECTKQIDKSRPVSSTPVPGSRWCVVWTGDGKVFFFDAFRKISVWETPEELTDRIDVKRLVECPPTMENEQESVVSSHSSVKKIKLEVGNTSTMNETSVREENEKPTIQELVLKAAKDREDIPHEKRIEMFMEMLSERNVSAFSTWEKELHKIVFDSRYLLLTPRERKQKFEKYVNAKVDEEKKHKKREFRIIKENYMGLLQEAGVTPTTRFSDFAHKYFKDLRFQAVERTREKVKYFSEFIYNLQGTVSQSFINEKQISKFMELLKEQTQLKEDSSWSEFKKKISSDERYLAIHCEENKERIFLDFIRNSFPDNVSLTSKGKEDRINASIQTRRIEVERDLSVCMKELEEEKLVYKRENLNNSFKALLVDLVKNPDTKFRDAMRSLKADRRWEGVSDMRTQEREKLFEDHIHHLKSRKKVMFHKLLDEIFKDIDLTYSWRDVKRTIRADQRCAHFCSDEKKCEREFTNYMKNRLITAKEDYRRLLKETKIITHASKELIKSSNHLENIENTLAKDKRHLVLKCIEKERKKILMTYIDDLYRNGPPPPPTASEPSRR